MAEIDLGRVTSWPLTEVRTVLSRAETALSELRSRLPARLYQVDGEWTEVYPWYRTTVDVGIEHPELDEMIEALEQVVAELARWERTGRSKRRKR